MRARTAAALLVASTLAACVNAPPETTHPRQDAIRFVGQSGVARANGIFRDWRIVEARVDPEAPEKSRVEIEIDVASLDTGFERRDEHLRDPDFFDTARWPHARARVTELHAVDDTPDRYRARFEIAIRDRQEDVWGEVSVASERPLVVEGEVVLDRTHFGVGPPDQWWNPMSPRDAVPVRFRVTLDAPGEASAQGSSSVGASAPSRSISSRILTR